MSKNDCRAVRRPRGKSGRRCRCRPARRHAPHRAPPRPPPGPPPARCEDTRPNTAGPPPGRTPDPADCTRRNDCVPLVVVSTTSLPCTIAGEYSRGELPRSNPAMRTAPRSPPSSTSCRRRRHTSASSGVATGTTPRAPFSSAVSIVVVARSTSMTATAPKAVASIRAASLWSRLRPRT